MAPVLHKSMSVTHVVFCVLCCVVRMREREVVFLEREGNMLDFNSF